MSGYLVAIDGGGTKTDYLVADEQCKVLKKISHSPTNLTTNGLGIAAFNLREGLRLLLEDLPTQDIKVLVMAVAGLDTVEEEEQADQIFSEVLNTWKINEILLVNDSMAALVNGSDKKAAIILIGGTGSNCLGYNEQNKKVKVGGLDFILTDDGSGYDAGRLTLKAAVRSYDGRGRKTILENMVFESFGVKKASELKASVYNPLLTKGEIARFAELCVVAAHQGDSVAQIIIDHCLNELTLNVVTVADKLELSQKAFDLVLAGSFILNLLPEFKVKIQSTLPQAQIIVPELAPVYGALKIAQKISQGVQPARWLV